MENQQSKEILLKLCSRILKADKGTINILRTQPICNLRSVQRKAKNIKDPNPLASMMSTIATKYPISVDTFKAKQLGMPPDLIHLSDVHQYGRTMCKLEAVEWYLLKASNPSEDVIKAIDVLYHNKRKEVSNYFSYNWAGSKVNLGTTFIVRKIINTQDPLVEIPNAQRTDYIMSCLMQEFILNYDQLNPVIVEKLKEIRDLKLVSKMTIQSQLRILINSLNPRPRCIPCLEGAPTEINRMRHAFSSSYYEITAPRGDQPNKINMIPLLNKIGEALCVILSRGSEVDAKKLFKYLRSSTYGEETLPQLIEREPTMEGTFVNYLLTFMGYPVCISSQVRGFKFYPLRGNTKAEMTRTTNGVRYVRYMGEEDVQVHGDGFSCIFRRTSSMLMGMNIKKTDRNTLTRGICAIAEYCRIGFQDSPGRNIREVKRNIEEKYTKSPWEVLRMTREDWKGILHFRSLGMVTFSDEIEMSPPLRERGHIYKRTIKYNDGNEVNIDLPNKKPMFPPQYEILGSDFIDFLSPKKRLTRKLQYFVHNYPCILQAVKKGDYCWSNESIIEGVATAIRKTVALTAQSMILEAMERGVHPIIVSFLYCFAGVKTNFLPTSTQVLQFTWFSNYKFDFSLSSGDFTFGDNGIQLFNNVFDETNNGEIDKFLPSFLPGYSFMGSQDDSQEFKSVTYLRNKESQIPHGTLYNFSIFGKTFLVKRDITAQAALRRTIMRNMKSLAAPGLFERMLDFTNSRKRPFEETDDDQPSTSRSVRQRVQVQDEMDDLLDLEEEDIEDIDLDDDF